MCKKNLLTIVAMAMLALAIGQVQAVTVTVPIVNPGFEDPVLGEDDWTWLDVPGWALVGGQGAGVWNVTSADFDPVLAPEGQNVLYTENAVGDPGGVTQVLTETFAASTDYTLTVEVGNSWYYYFSGYSVQLLAGGVVIAEDNDTLWPDYYKWATSTVEYTYDPADAALVGQPLEIRLLTLALDKDNPPAGEVVGVEFDNVTLSYDYDPTMARNPSPADGATDVPLDVALSWTPGEFAAPTNGHKVYFGESFNEVNDATGGVAQTANSYTPPQGLDFGKTYYWRVDEVNAPPTSHTEFKGEVWSFTTEPIAYPIDGNNITATASSSDVGMGPENTVNGSGLDANDLHSIASTAMWLSSSSGPQPTWIQYEFDRAYKVHEMWVWNYNVQFEHIIGFGLKDVTVQYSTNGVEWKALGDVEFAWGPGAAGYEHETIVDFGGVVAKYVKITAKSNWGGRAEYGLSEVRFLYVPVWAREPSPDSGATGVGVDNATVSWRAGREAALHKVYFSASRKAVIDETISPASIFADSSYASYDTGELDLGQTYYWKVNEVNEAETPTTWQGDIWSFKTAEYLVVDDFESYGDGTDPGPPPLPGNRIWYTWKDGGGWQTPAPGWGGNGTGSVIDLSTSTTHDGSKSMSFEYRNDGSTGKARYSETFREWASPRDWTRNKVKALTLYFYGDPVNAAEQLYVALEDNAGHIKVVNHPDPEAVQIGAWQEWNIELTQFSAAGVNLAAVKRMYIGLGNRTTPMAGGTGKIYIDDILVYPSRCVPSMGKPAADLSGNCVVDQADVDILANLWLDSGFEITPVNPGTAGLIAHYPLNGNANDVVGGHNGTINGNPQWVTGHLGGALKFGGSGDYVEVGYSPDLALNEFTVSAWVKVSADPDLFGILGTRSGGEYTFDVKVQATNVHGDIGNGTAWINTAIDIRSGDTGTTGQGGDLVVYRWYMIAYVIDNARQQVRLYLDGDLKRSISISGTPLLMQSGESMRIGHTGTGSEWMNGLIDEVRIYKRALSGAEIAWLTGYTSPFSIPADLRQDGKIDFKDFAVLADSWLDEQLWP